MSDTNSFSATRGGVLHFIALFINPRLRAYAARVAVVVLRVCLSVGLSTAILALQATRVSSK